MRARRILPLALALSLLGSAGEGPARAEDVPQLAPATSAARVAPADAAPPVAITEDEAAPAEEGPSPAAAPNPAAPGAQPRPPSRPRRTSYVVASGDTLGGIAYRNDVTVAALAAANGFSRTATLRVGQTLVVPAPGETVRTPPRVHVIAQGNTLGSIARSYGASIDAIRKANRLEPGATLQIGQKLVIPGDDGARPPESALRSDSRPTVSETGMQELDVRGSSAPTYYYEPTGPGRNGMRPVIVYLHGRGADPAQYCRRWSRVARNLGWLVCPSGPEDRGEGHRGWSNNWYGGRNVVMSAIEGLRKKYGRRVQLYGNTLIGFSEGAYVAMNVGLREPHTFNRWLILGADGDYWGASGLADLPEARGRVRRVYLITGRHDDVVDDTDEVRKWLLHAGVPVRISTPRDMGHEVALDTKAGMYQAALRWLADG